MSFETIVDKVAEFGTVSDNEVKLIKEYFKVEYYKKHELLVETEDDCNKIFFVINGGLRIYKFSSNVETTRSFVFENKFCTNLISFTTKGENNEFIEAIEDTTVLAIKRDDFYIMLEKSAVLTRLYAKILEQSVNFILYQYEFLNTLNERQRVEKFFNDYPEIILRVKDKIIASYIGVSPEYFSRIKSEIVKKK